MGTSNVSLGSSKIIQQPKKKPLTNAAQNTAPQVAVQQPVSSNNGTQQQVLVANNTMA